jgi:hypothetical protein
MLKKKYSLCNLFMGTRLDIEASNLKEAATYGYVLLYDQEKESDAEELTMGNGEKAISLSGKDKEKCEQLITIVTETRVVEETPEFKMFEKMY